MRCLQYLRDQRGSVLIFVLWTVGLLGLFAAQIGLRIRQRAELVSKIDTRNRLHHIASAGIKKSLSALKSDLRKNQAVYTPYGKMVRHNNQEIFKDVEIGQGRFSVYYHDRDTPYAPEKMMYGMVDEERKLNVNFASAEELYRLIQNVADQSDQRAKSLAEAIIDWREIGLSEAGGFYSTSYYANLDDPYEPKNAPFEVIDELRLIAGMTDDVFDRLTPFLTVYGGGQVNINTAPAEVLAAMGLSEPVVEKVISVRRGPDNREATADDFIFRQTHDIASDMIHFVKMEVSEIKEIDRLNHRGRLTTNSAVYRAVSRGKLDHKRTILDVACVFDLNDNKILYWREKY